MAAAVVTEAGPPGDFRVTAYAGPGVPGVMTRLNKDIIAHTRDHLGRDALWQRL